MIEARRRLGNLQIQRRLLLLCNNGPNLKGGGGSLLCYTNTSPPTRKSAMGMYSYNRRRITWSVRHPSRSDVNDLKKVCSALALFVFVGLPILYVANATFTYGSRPRPLFNQPQSRFHHQNQGAGAFSAPRTRPSAQISRNSLLR